MVIAVAAFMVQPFLAEKYVVPVLMYHHVNYSRESRSDTVSPENFQRQMTFIKAYGYRVISLDEFIGGIKNNRIFPKKTVVLTFDDGYEDNYTYAFPVLRRLNFPATIFISPGFIGREGFLDWDEIKYMQDKGIQYGSHGMIQAYLPEQDEAHLIYEIRESKRILEKELKHPIKYYAYPVGGFSRDIKDRLMREGYEGAVATNRGYDRYNKDVFEVNRVKFSDKDRSSVGIWMKLSGYYNLFRKLKKPY